MKPSKDTEQMPVTGVPAEMLAWDQVDAFIETFPEGDMAGLICNPVNRKSYREGQISNLRDEYGRATLTRVRIEVDVRQSCYIPAEERGDRLAPTCEQPLVLEDLSDNPDYYICIHCKKIHHHHFK